MLRGVARAGEVIENPVTGERVRWIRTAAETNGEVSEYELTFRPSGFVAQQHLHPSHSELHAVVEGEVGLELDGREQVLRPGDSVLVEPRTPHRLFPVGDAPATVRFEVRPALRVEQLIETFVNLARDGKVGKRGYPNLLRLAVIARGYEAEGYATKPPLGVQRVLFGPLAALGRLLGYRPQYP
jgi:quercetin dioxygenase-like cupin family protein